MKNITCACGAPTSHRCEHLDMSRHRCLPPKSCGRPVCDEHSVEWPHDVRWCVQCAAGMHPMRGLTLWEPWLWAILDYDGPDPKRLENRPWSPPRWLVGGYVVLHAGGRYHLEAAILMREMGLTVPDASDLPLGRVRGVARVTGWTPPGEPLDSRWRFRTEHSWHLDTVTPIGPISTPGGQRLWKLETPRKGRPRDLAQRVRQEFWRARKAPQLREAT